MTDNGWQMIETAPDEGWCLVWAQLVFERFGGRHESDWMALRLLRDREAPIGSLHAWRVPRLPHQDDARLLEIRATHWRPLPPPPRPDDPQQQGRAGLIELGLGRD